MWRTAGEVLGADGETVVQTFSGTDTYEWLGPFVIHRVDVTMGEDNVRSLEVVGSLRRRAIDPHAHTRVAVAQLRRVTPSA